MPEAGEHRSTPLEGGEFIWITTEDCPVEPDASEARRMNLYDAAETGKIHKIWKNGPGFPNDKNKI